MTTKQDGADTDDGRSTTAEERAQFYASHPRLQNRSPEETALYAALLQAQGRVALARGELLAANLVLDEARRAIDAEAGCGGLDFSFPCLRADWQATAEMAIANEAPAALRRVVKRVAESIASVQNPMRDPGAYRR